MLKRLIATLTLLLLAPLAVAEDYVEGTHYDLVTPSVHTQSGDKIEVVEFFWYGCSHCYNFEPLVSAWSKGLASDVLFRPSPAMWNGPMEIHAKAFYAAEALGETEKLHAALFSAMNVENKRLKSEDEIAEVFSNAGISAADFKSAYNSFGVSSQVRQADSRARGAKITGTPEMMVAGKYRISTRKAGTQANMLKIADYLVAKERAARAGS